ncbi:MAG TPA: 1-(5-phosphoribosyl)-5-[(5-phosphoribosylamino)methylideneamino]imidazole-4-carboxamide isomerase [Tepidisphaeraceae bacterium]|nr:1-(5-phosphoribosyl)-5-[(5-phosphoribosylamino)methylideneamino]imidazole-4-carboxamide isomerase [Tepidisphaeraceae bacterium]
MFQVIPSIDLRGGKVVRLQQGDYARQLDYDLDPVDTARSFAATGAQWMHIVDLDGAKEERVAQIDLIKRMIDGCGMRVQVGGGVRSTDDIQRLLAAGADRVVIGTHALENWSWFEKLAAEKAMQGKLVLAVDAKDGHIATRAWTQTTERLAVDVAKQVSGWGLAALLYTDVAKDGMLQGPNFTQTRLLAEAGDTPIIASGGVGSLDHIRQLLALSIWGVIIGRSLHDGRIALADAIKLANS